MELRISFFIVKKRAKAGKVPVYVRIKVGTTVAEMSANIYVNEAHWIGASGTLKANTEANRTDNVTLQIIQSALRRYYNAMCDRGMAPTAQDLKDAYSGKTESARSIVRVFESHIQFIYEKAELGKASRQTAHSFEKTLLHLKGFLKAKYNKEDMAIKDLGYEFAEGFFNYLLLKKKLSQNTTKLYVDKLKVMTNDCLRKGWITTNPVGTYKTEGAKTDRVKLTTEQIAAIENADLHTSKSNMARDTFVFQIYTGLAYADIKKLSWDDIVRGIDKRNWIKVKRQKRMGKEGGEGEIPIMPKAQTILDKYKPYKFDDNRVFQMPDEVTYNWHLRNIAKIAGIDKQLKGNLSSHVGRHTFASTICLDNNVPIETVSKLLIHSKITTTQVYAKVSKTKMAHDISELEARLSSSPQLKEKIFISNK